MGFKVALYSDAVIPRVTKEQMLVAVQADSDPTAKTVQIATLKDATSEPGDIDWNPAGWLDLTEVAQVDGLYVAVWIAAVLVSGMDGGGTIELDPGKYWIWIQISDAGQAFVRQAGILEVV